MYFFYYTLYLLRINGVQQWYKTGNKYMVKKSTSFVTNDEISVGSHFILKVQPEVACFFLLTCRWSPRPRGAVSPENYYNLPVKQKDKQAALCGNVSYSLLFMLHLKCIFYQKHSQNVWLTFSAAMTAVPAQMSGVLLILTHNSISLPALPGCADSRWGHAGQ